MGPDLQWRSVRKFDRSDGQDTNECWISDRKEVDLRLSFFLLDGSLQNVEASTEDPSTARGFLSSPPHLSQNCHPTSLVRNPVRHATMSEANASPDRHAEIWATRVQRELLALTTDDAEASSVSKAALPPFITIQEHSLDIATATCTVNFQVQITTKDAVTQTVIGQLDVSLPKNADGSFRQTPVCYPFCEPEAKLLQGEEFFADGSTIQNGDLIPIDIEWTPSLHLVSHDW